jgi:catalase
MISKLFFYMKYYISFKLRVGLALLIALVVGINLLQFASLYEKQEVDHNVPQNVVGIFQRLDAIVMYVKFSYRAKMYDRQEHINAPVARSRAILHKMSKDGKLNFKVLTKDGSKHYSGYFADLEVINLPAAAQYISKHSLSRVNIDYYKSAGDLYVVIWFNDGTPVNQMLVKNGWAKAVAKPPSNIVNRLLAEYYYNIAF